MLMSVGQCKYGRKLQLQLRFDLVTSDYKLPFPCSRDIKFLFCASRIKSQLLFFIKNQKIWFYT